MATLISETEFRSRFDIAASIEPTRIVPHIGSASRRLRAWVGTGVYNQALADASSATASDVLSDLKNAEAHLTFHYALLGLNSPLTTKGVVATSIVGEGKQTTRYLSPSQTAELSAQFLELAREIADGYAVADGTPTTTYEIAAGLTAAEAVTRPNSDSDEHHHHHGIC